MNLHVKVSENRNSMSLEHAISTGKVTIQNYIVHTQANVILSISTQLLDDTDQEIYENDIVRDATGKRFQISYLHGTFFATSIDSPDFESKEMLPLYLLQCNGHIPVKICNE